MAAGLSETLVPVSLSLEVATPIGGGVRRETGLDLHFIVNLKGDQLRCV
jgi:hypothetical protein